MKRARHQYVAMLPHGARIRRHAGLERRDWIFFGVLGAAAAIVVAVVAYFTS